MFIFYIRFKLSGTIIIMFLLHESELFETKVSLISIMKSALSGSHEQRLQC